MLIQKSAKLFMNGNSQAVRLPLEFRFDAEEVYVSRDALTGDVTLSTSPSGNVWVDFFEFTGTIADSRGYMDVRELNAPPAADGVFDDLRPTQMRKRV